MQMMRPPEGDK